MKVLVLGATGYVGKPVVRQLRQAGHKITALTHRKEAMNRLKADGYKPVLGDMAQPGDWQNEILAADAIIHMAATFDDDEGKHEANFLNGLIKILEDAEQKKRFVYTGGCWLYGATGDGTAIEGSDFDALPAFQYSVEHREKIFESDVLDAVVLHPAMVWDRDGGTLSRFIQSAQTGGPIPIVGSLETRWPMVHRDDLAVLYQLVLEKGRPGKDYHGSAGPAVTVETLARAVARRFAYAPEFKIISPDLIARELGQWARGYAIDQQMSANRTMLELGWSPKYTDVLDTLNPYGALPD